MSPICFTRESNKCLYISDHYRFFVDTSYCHIPEYTSVHVAPWKIQYAQVAVVEMEYPSLQRLGTVAFCPSHNPRTTESAQNVSLRNCPNKTGFTHPMNVDDFVPTVETCELRLCEVHSTTYPL
jgi:hypothetical protein